MLLHITGSIDPVCYARARGVLARNQRTLFAAEFFPTSTQLRKDPHWHYTYRNSQGVFGLCPQMTDVVFTHYPVDGLAQRTGSGWTLIKCELGDPSHNSCPAN